MLKLGMGYWESGFLLVVGISYYITRMHGFFFLSLFFFRLLDHNNNSIFLFPLLNGLNPYAKPASNQVHVACICRFRQGGFFFLNTHFLLDRYTRI